jgi:hypothetical protein
VVDPKKNIISKKNVFVIKPKPSKGWIARIKYDRNIVVIIKEKFENVCYSFYN